jgi:hypothetical protein
MLTCCVLIAASAFAAPDVKHVKVYYEPGRFGGWPANHGIWSWGDEILVGFSRGYYKDLGPERHNIDRDKPEEHCLARSLDGGETWTIEHPNENGYLIPQGESLHGTETPGLKLPEWKQCAGGIDFLNPNFAVTLRMTSADAAPSRFSYSYDRGKTWEGPFRLPNFDTPGIAARTDYIVSGHSDCLFFLTAAKSNGKEGRPLCVQTRDGGKTFDFVSWIAPEIKGGFEIMPASARLSDTDILVVTRHHEGARKWLSSYITHDNGRTWTHLNDPVESTGEGNPPTLTLMRDGRLCLIYGYRAQPFSMRAKLSKDGGKTWSDDIVLRDDGITRDIGYPRTVQRPDGKIVTVYYWCTEETKPDRYIAATIWNPGN